jgi:hypothetical protein
MKQGKLYLNEIGRYAIDEYTELKSGDIVEVSLDDKNWLKTAIEHADYHGGYYATINPKMSLKGLYCRK